MGSSRKMEFPRVLKKYHVKIPEVKEKRSNFVPRASFRYKRKREKLLWGWDWNRSGISRSDQEKIIWNFHGSWFLTLEFPRCVAPLSGISRGEALFSPEFPEVKMANLKILGFFKKNLPSTSPHLLFGYHDKKFPKLWKTMKCSYIWIPQQNLLVNIYAQYDNTYRNYLMKNYRRWGKIERSNQAQDQHYGSLTLFWHPKKRTV